MTNPPQTIPPSAPPPPASRPPVAALSRELSDFLVEFSITLNKHAIYPLKHPLLDIAIDGVATRLALLFDEHRDSLSIGVARRQLIIEGVATDPLNPVLKELAQKLHNHHIGALKLIRGITREELAQALRELSSDPVRSEKPIGHDLERVGDMWDHVRFFPLTYDRLQLIEDAGKAEPPSPDQMAAGRSAQLWIGLARAALVSDTLGASAELKDSDDNQSLEPATVARAIDEHQREDAYDQVIVGYLLQIGEELRSAEGPEAAGLQRRVSRLVGSLKESTLEKLLEMGGDKVQRRKFLLDASQGIAIEAVIDLVKAASAAEGQTVSHSMLRMLSKLANHPSSGGPRQQTDPTVRDVMRRLVQEWSLDDPNPEAYRQVLESMSSLKNVSEKAPSTAVPTECEPHRMIQIAIEVGGMGPQVRTAMVGLWNQGKVDVLLDLVERAPNADAAAPVWDFLVGERTLDSLLSQERVDLPLVGRFARRIGMPAVPSLIEAAITYEDAKTRTQFYDLIQSLGEDVGPHISERIAGATPLIQREILAFLGRLGGIPAGFSASHYFGSPDPLVRREAARLMLRDPAARDKTILTALADTDDRVVFVGLTAAQEKIPPGAAELMRQRVDRGELDAQLRTMCIRIVGQQRTPQTLTWLLGHVLAEARWQRRPKLRPSTPEMLAALNVIVSGWRNDPAAAAAITLAEHSKDSEVRAKVARARDTDGKAAKHA
jgi:hypothetical protein